MTAILLWNLACSSWMCLDSVHSHIDSGPTPPVSPPHSWPTLSACMNCSLTQQSSRWLFTTLCWVSQLHNLPKYNTCTSEPIMKVRQVVTPHSWLAHCTHICLSQNQEQDRQQSNLHERPWYKPWNYYKKTQGNASGHWSVKSFLDMHPKAQVTKVKTDKWNYIQLRSYCIAKETNNRVKRQPTEWEKHFQAIQLTRLIRDLHSEYNRNSIHQQKI
jgi:hypothetical protein